MGSIFHEKGWDQREVTVERKRLLDTLKTNRDKHIEDYKQSCDGYRIKAIEVGEKFSKKLRDAINKIKTGGPDSLIYLPSPESLAVPRSQEAAYNQAIAMVDMSVGDNFVLTAGQFSCWVMDDWDWKDSWSKSNALYQSLGVAAANKV